MIVKKLIYLNKRLIKLIEILKFYVFLKEKMDLIQRENIEFEYNQIKQDINKFNYPLNDLCFICDKEKEQLTKIWSIKIDSDLFICDQCISEIKKE